MLQMDLRREPFKTKDNNRPMCRAADIKNKPSQSGERICTVERAASPRVNPTERQGTEVAHALGIGAAAPAGPSLLSTWGEELAQAMLEMDMLTEQEYAMDFFTYMMRKQSAHVFRPVDIPKSVTAEMRNVLVDWLIQVHEYLALEEETLYLAVYLLNFYLSERRIHTSKLQLLASTCLFIACKIEESLIPEPAELCFMMGDAYGKKELLKMERKVLYRLRFDLSYTQPVHFLRLLSLTGKCPEKISFLAMYFMELTLREADGMMIEPALLACAALRLAQVVVTLSCGLQMSPAVPRLYSYSDAELLGSLQLMARSALRSDANSTWQKFSRPQRLEVSAEPALSAKNLRRCIGSLSLQRQAACPVTD
uniref:Cyclin P n=1 Tax=Leptobrachium leishanense TaxID=445787 RepID=A0A8C5Q7Z4_9ANUR